jgi:hypothetical protein
MGQYSRTDGQIAEHELLAAIPTEIRTSALSVLSHTGDLQDLASRYGISGALRLLAEVYDADLGDHVLTQTWQALVARKVGLTGTPILDVVPSTESEMRSVFPAAPIPSQPVQRGSTLLDPLPEDIA